MIDGQNISDNRLHHMLANYLDDHKNNPRLDMLKGIKLCGSQLITKNASHAVEIYANSKDAHFFGTATCHSAWACPRCTAKVMAEKGARIACLIDALAKKGLYAFMLTFTLPHTDNMTCTQAFDVLQATWRMFSRDGNNAKKADGKANGIFGIFRAHFNIRYFVRVFEFTWGNAHGWHPHIHALFFTQKENFNELLNWEDKLTDRWIDCAKTCHLKLLNGHYKQSKFVRINNKGLNTGKKGGSKETWRLRKETTPQSIFISQLYADYKRRPVTGHRAVYFSRDNKGKVKIEKSSRYICGWGANSELTREGFKDNHVMGGRFSPFEMLKLAQEAKSKTIREHWLKLFIEYALATRGYRRCCFSPNAGKIIEEYMKTNDYIELFKKNNMDRAREDYQKVFWFNAAQWSHILNCETKNDDIRSKLLELAIKSHPERRIIKFLAAYGIDVSKNAEIYEFETA